MIGLPLRLLAREIYDRVVKARGARAVALVTGEEKIVPPRPQYWVCTVEAMPLSIEVDFLAVDEVQLAADPERGHVFTHRLLHARGRSETMLLGAGTMAPLIRRLLPEAEITSRERFSELSYDGSRKLTRLPRRSADRRLLGRQRLRHRRADPPPARRRGGGHGLAQPAHPQRPGGALPVRRGRLPGGHRRHRHGPEHGRRPRGLRGAAQVRRQAHPLAARPRDRPDRRPRGALPHQRDLRGHRRVARDRRGPGRGGGEPPLRAARPPRSGAAPRSTSPAWPSCSARWPPRPAATG